MAFRLRGSAAAGGLERRRPFNLRGIGGYQDQIRTLLNRQSDGETGIVRGYRGTVASGQYATVGQAEYRLPVLDVDRGVGSGIPAAIERIAFSAFTDWGLAWTAPPQLRDILGGVGASLIFDLKIGFQGGLRLKALYARGLDKELGSNYFQFRVSQSF